MPVASTVAIPVDPLTPHLAALQSPGDAALEAVWALGRSRQRVAWEGLRTLLRHPDPALRAKVLSATGDWDHPEVASEAARLLADDGAVEVRIAAAHLIGQARSWTPGAEALVRALPRATMAAEAKAIVSALGARPEPVAREALRTAVRDLGLVDPLRAAAARALAEQAVGPTGAAEELRSLARSEGSPDLRAAFEASADLADGRPAPGGLERFAAITFTSFTSR